MSEQPEPVNVWQEIRCRTSGGGCGGFILFRLNAHLNTRVKFTCPKCSHQHERIVRNGLVVDDGQRGLICQMTLRLTMANYSAEPRTEEMKRHCLSQNGSAFATSDPAVLQNKPSPDPALRESWRDRFSSRFLPKRT